MTTTTDHHVEVLTWEVFGLASRQLAVNVAESGYRPDLILAIARGGLPVGGALGYALGVKNCATINVEFYTGVGERMEVPVVLPPGITLALVGDLVRPHVKELRSAVLYKKPWSVVEPDYFWGGTDGWIDFPWSSQPPVI